MAAWWPTWCADWPRPTSFTRTRSILLDGIGSDLFWFGIIDRPWQLFGARVYITPESQGRITANPDYGDVDDFVLPAAAVRRALSAGEIVVYNGAGQRLRNVTGLYAETSKFTASAALPRDIEVGNPLLSWLLGPEWYPSEVVHRWMPRRATLRMGGPDKPGEALYVSGSCPEILQPVSLTAVVDGTVLAAQPVPPGGFTLKFPLPDKTAGEEKRRRRTGGKPHARQPGHRRDQRADPVASTHRQIHLLDGARGPALGKIDP